MFDNLDPEIIPNLKLGLHIAQIFLAFVAWCLEIAVFRDPNSFIIGNNGWAFAVCFLSIPAWIYLCMAPRYSRTRKFANIYAMATVDGLFTILWMSAWAAQAAYNTANLCGTACGESKAIVAMGFFVFLLFGATTFVSLYTVQFYKFNNRLPGYDRIQTERRGGQNIDPDKAAFSMAPHDEEAYAQVNLQDHDDHHDDHDHDMADDVSGYDSGNNGRYGGASSPGAYGAAGASIAPENPFGAGAEYHSPHGRHSPAGRVYTPPIAHDDPHDEYETGPVHFPAGNYDRVVE